MQRKQNRKSPASQNDTGAVTGSFVASASAAYRYYASNESARAKAVKRFENRLSTVNKSSRPTSAKKSRRSA